MNLRSFVPKGAASFRVDYDGPPKDIYFVLLPKLTMLAFSAAVEPLRVANQVTGKELYRWFLMSEDGAPVGCSNGIGINTDLPLEDLPRGSYAFVCSGIEPSDSANPRTLAWIRRQNAHGGRFGGICTGAFALAQAGILQDQRFTLHWENQPSFSEYFPGLEPSANLYEIDKGLMTCGGGNAATDMMLEMIETDHGKDLAVIVSDMCIHFRSNNREALQKSAYSVALSSRNQHLINAMQFMHDTIEEPVEIGVLADRAQISRRQLERLFQRYVGTSPVQFYIELRVGRALALLNETNMTVAEISAATGFSSATQLSIRFKKRYGQSPASFRKSWTETAARE
ncbi:GlxA family transcriptional regulator [Leisingera sp. M527]|uniref:GlxA family transcriptional regulator n=1 Tax=unclassified Leisingera TaxID=2614906 RepID=UPI0021A7A25B|nr:MULTISPECIES: GlxA family transcriptional regulator [unclassified Leisingera]UWQ29724.1 GlxA family transcriptional regulator [Leisingera sp. M523]UWQ33937.1 GlxA family transcriptional regulator [Leisingera sp. M527]